MGFETVLQKKTLNPHKLNDNMLHLTLTHLKYHNTHIEYHRTYISVSTIYTHTTEMGNVNFSRLTITDCVINTQSFDKCLWNETVIKDTVFLKCDFSFEELQTAVLLNVQFIDCNLYGTKFPPDATATFQHCNFIRSDNSVQTSKYDNCQCLSDDVEFICFLREKRQNLGVQVNSDTSDHINISHSQNKEEETPSRNICADQQITSLFNNPMRTWMA